MKRKIIKISYIFSEPDYNVLRYGSDLISKLNITNNILLNIFRIQFDMLKLNSIEEYNIYIDKNRNDNTFIYFNSISSVSDISELIENNVIEFPAELNFIGLNCSFDYYINNLISTSFNKCVKGNFLNVTISICHDVIIIKFSREFYNGIEKEITYAFEEWENSMHKAHFRKEILI